MLVYAKNIYSLNVYLIERKNENLSEIHIQFIYANTSQSKIRKMIYRCFFFEALSQ